MLRRPWEAICSVPKRQVPISIVGQKDHIEIFDDACGKGRAVANGEPMNKLSFVRDDKRVNTGESVSNPDVRTKMEKWKAK